MITADRGGILENALVGRSGVQHYRPMLLFHYEDVLLLALGTVFNEEADRKPDARYMVEAKLWMFMWPSL